MQKVLVLRRLSETDTSPLEAPDDDEPIRIIPCPDCPGN
jgi:hypothetical protein